jgi:hydrophobe/amphiphile efflux-3 (HAE3) family protein
VGRFWAWLAVYLGKHALVVAVVGVIVTVTLGYGITKLEFATGQDSYLNKSDVVYKDNVAYQSLFGGQAMVVLMSMDKGKTIADLASPKNRRTIEAAQKQLEADPGIEAVITPLTAMQFSSNLIQRSYADPTNPEPAEDPTKSIAGTLLQQAIKAEKPGSAAAKAREADFAKTATRVLGIKGEKDLDNPEWVDFLIHDNDGKVRKPLQAVLFDDTHAQMVVRLKGNADIETEGNGATAVKQAWANRRLDGARVTVTGAPVLLKDINDYLRGGIRNLGAIAVGIMVLILLVLFNVRWRLLPMFVILVGVTWAFGLAGYLGIDLSVVTIAGLPVMLGIGIDYAIQMHARVEEEVVIDRSEHPIQETAKNLCPALLVVTFDAIFAFAALRWARVPMIRQFGLLLAVGIAVICLSSIIIPLAVLGIREYKSPTTGRDFREGFLGRFVVKMGSLSPKVAVPLAIVSVAIFFGGIAVESKLVLQTDPEQWVNQHSQTTKDLRTLQREANTSSELGVFVRSNDLFSDKVAKYLSDFTYAQLDKHGDNILTANSIATPASFLTELEGASRVPPTGEDHKAVYDAAPSPIQRTSASLDKHAFNLIFLTKPRSLEERAVVVDDIRAHPATPAGVVATPAGLAVVGVGLLKNLEANRVLLTYLAIAFVFAFLTIRLRSFIRALLSMVPVLIAVGTASLVAYAFGLKLSPMTAVGGPLVVAACTEFTSLILLRFVEERGRGLSPDEAVRVAAARTGRAFIVSALTAIAGVAVIATSSLPLLRGFGTIVAMNVTVALVSALVFLPPMLAWADRRDWVSKGLVPADVLGRWREEGPGPTAGTEPEPTPVLTD